MSLRFASACFRTLFLAALLVAVSRAAPADQYQSTSERRRTRLVAHIKRLERPSDWLILRKLYSSDRARQLEGFENCPYSEMEWPWYLSSGHLEKYTFTADFIPVNMDSDPEDETLIVIQSDSGEVNFATFCLVDDDKRGRTPLSSYSEISHQKPITFQLVDLTGDGDSEIIIHARDDRAGRFVDSVRIIKPNMKRQFDLVWFGRLRGLFVWPPVKDKAKNRTITRNESLRAKMRLSFNGSGSPATIILKGEREYENEIRYKNRTTRQAARKVSFEERWHWDKKLFRFLRDPDFE
jgi:hypothetical protein